MEIGNLELAHRIIMPAVSRMRATQDHVPTQMMLEYYVQYAAVPGTLMLAEPNLCLAGASWVHPCTWHLKARADCWLAENHRRCACQRLVHVRPDDGSGRIPDPAEAAQEGLSIIAPSAIPFMAGASVPRVMTTEDIHLAVKQFRQAARNVVEAGLDDVELLAANGMLVE
jgi:NADPH2 dehydrogenase